MTQHLEKAFAAVSKPPDDEQDRIAGWLLEELASDRQWDEAFAQSHSLLARLAEDALAEYDSGKTQPLIPENL